MGWGDRPMRTERMTDQNWSSYTNPPSSRSRFNWNLAMGEHWGYIYGMASERAGSPRFFDCPSPLDLII